jgi:hypothetical protein
MLPLTLSIAFFVFFVQPFHRRKAMKNRLPKQSFEAPMRLSDDVGCSIQNVEADKNIPLGAPNIKASHTDFVRIPHLFLTPSIVRSSYWASSLTWA